VRNRAIAVNRTVVSLVAAASLRMPDRHHAFDGVGADPAEIDEASRGGEVAGLHVD
jgi:hypothetical protein